MQVITDDEFKSVLGIPGVTVVVFSASWCGPCKTLTPVIEGLEPEYADKVKFYKVDIDQSPVRAAELGVRGIPNIMFYKDGELKGNRIGALPRNKLRECLAQLL